MERGVNYRKCTRENILFLYASKMKICEKILRNFLLQFLASLAKSKCDTCFIVSCSLIPIEEIFSALESCIVPAFPVSPCPIYSKGVLISFTDSISSWKNFCTVTPMKEQRMNWIITKNKSQGLQMKFISSLFALCNLLISMPPKMLFNTCVRSCWLKSVQWVSCLWNWKKWPRS